MINWEAFYLMVQVKDFCDTKCSGFEALFKFIFSLKASD